VCPAPHLAHEPLLLHLATELAQRLLELLRILYDDLQTVITPFSENSVVTTQTAPAGREER
jgi:hypothetical protein